MCSNICCHKSSKCTRSRRRTPVPGRGVSRSCEHFPNGFDLHLLHSKQDRSLRRNPLPGRGARPATPQLDAYPGAVPPGPTCSKEKIFIELMTSDRKLKASREGSKCNHSRRRTALPGRGARAAPPQLDACPGAVPPGPTLGRVLLRHHVGSPKPTT